ncbi:hypothetical protein B2K_40090 [Paenibacillus mucilaginosus K02]|uniref:Uncharacterized protein n=1 Tax=Paenibacillus mucilaginosus K02 TaxID=997761 RepID=R9ULW0_9BACL|nr:hypothetical protein B2K_40090 [Paenibacillus mucilaginosus K02]
MDRGELSITKENRTGDDVLMMNLIGPVPFKFFYILKYKNLYLART